jgi:hypothetical protein
MKTLFHIIRIFMFLIFASFASTSVAVTVNSELGGASLNGTWTVPGCNLDPGEVGDQYYEEYLVFTDTSVDVVILGYGTADSTCSGIGSVYEQEMFDFITLGDESTEGWEVDPQPSCQNPDACPDQTDPKLLDPMPDVTELEIELSATETETIYFYIDDTGGSNPDLPWLMYRTLEETEPLILSVEEPLVKTADLDIGVIPVPAGIWLFGTALIGFVGYSRRRKIG